MTAPLPTMRPLEYTASIMLNVLQASTEPIVAAAFRTAVELKGGDPEQMPFAAKWLRDRGMPVVTLRRGPQSTWFLAKEGARCMSYMEQEADNWLSEAVSVARATSRLKGTSARKARSKAVAYAVVLGERQGLSPEEVVELCRPIEVPA